MDHPLKIYRDSHQPPLSQVDLARLLGVNPPTLNRWETGKRQIDVDSVRKISAKTGIPPMELRPDLAEKLGAVDG
jgi:DNA-binding transcriptional regulator YdaS (Cro superfamily)